MAAAASINGGGHQFLPLGLRPRMAVPKDVGSAVLR
jgi:hypothetical protein